MPKKVKKSFYLDYSILIPYLVLCGVGLIMIYSASSYKLLVNHLDPASLAINQAIYFVLSLLLITFIYKMKMKIFEHRNVITFSTFVIGVLLILTRFTSLGVVVNGAQGWLKIPGLGQLQPAEFLKIMIIWYLSYIISKRQGEIITNFKDATLRPLLVVLGLIFLVAIQPDNGGAAILFLIAVLMLLASGVNYLYSLIFGGSIAIGSLLGIKLIVWSGGKIFPKNLKYVYDRFAVFANPFLDAQGDGHQIVNSYYAIYNGGLFGVGLGNSTQKKGFLPEAQTDFMFSIVLEELGLIIAVLILCLLLFLVLRIILVGIRAKNPFNSLMCIGVGGMILIQTFINIGGISGLIPLTGVTFPFISQGGSSLLMLSISIGLVLNISADEKKNKHNEMVVNMQEITEG